MSSPSIWFLAGKLIKPVLDWWSKRRERKRQTKEAGDAEVRDWLGRRR